MDVHNPSTASWTARFRFSPKEWWRTRPFLARVLLVALGGGLIFYFGTLGLKPLWQDTPPTQSMLVGVTEVPFGKAVDRAITDQIQAQVEPRLKTGEDAQKKTSENVEALGKRVTTLETPPKPFDYELFYQYASGKKK